MIVNLVYLLCSRQDIYAMLDLDMPLSEAALRTEGRDQLVSDLTFSGLPVAHFGHGEIPTFFSAAKIPRLIIFLPIRSPVDSEINLGSAGPVCFIRHQSFHAAKCFYKSLRHI